MTIVSIQTPIAFLGMGLMGSRMSQRLLEAGFPVAVWNRTAKACTPLIEKGAHALQLDQLSHYPIVMLCLADDQAVEAVVEQILPHLTAGQICIDFSSLSVQKTLDIAARLKQKDIVWIDSPVSGGVIGAEQGTLVVFAGGDADIIEKLSPIYRPLAQRVTCMGATSTGQATKICNQLIVAASSTLIAEAITLAEKAGVDASLLAPALKDGFADSKPFQILSPRMASKNFEPVQWKVQTLSKDLNNAVMLAKQFNQELPVAQQALNQFKKHQEQGFSEKDLSTIVLHLSHQD